MFCRKCGNKINEDSKFCGKCGEPVKAHKAFEGEELENTRKIPIQDGEQVQSSQGQEEGNRQAYSERNLSHEYNMYEEEKSKKKKGFSGKLALGILLGCFVVLLGTGFWFIAGRDMFTASASSQGGGEKEVATVKDNEESIKDAMEDVEEDLETSPKSRESILMRLTSVHDLSEEEAKRALDKLDIDFKEQAALSAFNYVESQSDRPTIEQLKTYLMEELLFEEKEANYAIIEVQEEREKEDQIKLQEAASKVEEKKKPVPKAQTISGDILTYFVENCNSTYFSREDISSFTASEARIARNAIYAHHGWSFQDDSLRNYFENYPWYSPSVSPKNFKESWLNSYERANKELILKFEKDRGYNQ